MGTGEGKKKGSQHVASESISSEYSLSFAGLVCIHDQQQPKPYVPNHDKFIRVSKTDPDFEFDIHTKNNSSATPINKIKAQQQEVATLFQPNSPPIISLSTLLGIGDHNGHTEVVIRKGRNHANKEGSVRRKTFGKKVCKSFLAPCRHCKAIQPSAVKQQTTVSGDKSKLLT